MRDTTNGRILFTPRLSLFGDQATRGETFPQTQGSASAPSSLSVNRDILASHFSEPLSRDPPASGLASLWEMVRAQQRQITDLQKMLMELSASMGQLQVSVAERTRTPSLSDSEDCHISDSQSITGANYKSKRWEYMGATSLLKSEWESLRKTKILALPAPTPFCSQEIYDDDSLTTPRVSDDYASRVHRLIQKYTT